MQARAFDMRRRALIWSLLRNFLVAVCMVGLGVGAIHVINAPPHPIEGARFVDHVELCVDAQCDATTPTALPLRIPRDAALALRQVTVRLDLGSAFNGGMAGANAVSAPDMRLMLPSVRRRLHVIEDGVTTFAPGAPGRPQWGEYNANNAPALVPLRSTTQDLRLTFDYIGQEGFVLFPMHIGPRHRVENTYKVRFALTRGLGVVSLVLMVLSLVMSIAMTVGRPDERVFAWLAVSNVAAVVVGLEYALPFDPLPYAYWMPLFMWAAQFYVLTLFKFVLRLLGRSFPKAEALHLWIVGFGFVLIFLVPGHSVTFLAALSSGVSVIWALVILAVFLTFRTGAGGAGFGVLFALLTLALAIACFDYLVYFTDVPIGPATAGQALPGVMMLATVWLIVSQLLHTIGGFERLNATLQTEVALKAQELEHSYRALAQAETARALENERARMMLELHDGVGGQIVNTMAYLEQSEGSDPVLRAALEDVLRDVGVMMDGYATVDAPVDVLLGGLRNRYEPLLERKGIRFDWRVGQGGGVPILRPDDTLHFLRIVQESITNTVKHAGASQITVWTSPNEVVLRDNGCGPQQGQQQGSHRPDPNRSGGMGLTNMDRRAQAIGVRFAFDSRADGTEVRLIWPE